MNWVLAPTAAALWVLTLDRFLLTTPTREEKVMRATMLFLTLSVTLNVPALWEGLGAVTGQGAVIIGDQLVSVTVEALVLLLVREVTGRGMSRRTIVAVAASVAVATTGLLLVLGPTSETMTYASAVRLHPGAWPWVSYWSLTITFAFWAFGVGARFYWRYPRRADEPGAALSILLIGVGTTIALLLTVLRAYVMFSAILGHLRSDQGWTLRVAALLAAALFFAIVAGLAAGPADSLLTWARTRRAERRSVAALEPLWQTLTGAVPNIALDHQAVILLMGARLSPRGKLYRRMIEVNDALLVLSAYTSAPLWQQALDRALLAGEAPPRAGVVADTVMLHLSLARYRARSLVAHPSTHLVTRGSADFPDEVQRLSEMAWTSEHCPLTARITQQLLEMESA